MVHVTRSISRLSASRQASFKFASDPLMVRQMSSQLGLNVLRWPGPAPRVGWLKEVEAVALICVSPKHDAMTCMGCGNHAGREAPMFWSRTHCIRSSYPAL